MRLLRAALPLVLLAATARASDETNRMAGGSMEELRAVLDLDAAQFRSLQTAFQNGDADLQRTRDTARNRGAVPTIDALIQVQDNLHKTIKDILHPNQLSLYEAWLEKKRRLADEYDKALFGIPAVTEIKLKLALSSETLEKMQKVADQAVTDIRKKIFDLRSAGAAMAAIGDSVNEIRQAAVAEMGKFATMAEKRKFVDYLNTWNKTPEDKLSRGELDHLDRVMKGLDMADGVLSDRVKALVAAILWHQEESGVLRRGLGKELALTLVQKKPEAEIWAALYEYGTLFDIHARRIKALRDDLQGAMPTKQIAKLVSEGVLE